MDLGLINFEDRRHSIYKEMQRLYDNYEHDWIIVKNINSKVGHPLIPIALPKEIVTLISDLGFSTPINAVINSNDAANNAVDQIIENNHLNMLLSEASLTQAIKGGVVCKNYLDNGVSKITFIEPDYYFPEFSPTDRRKVVRETIAFPVIDIYTDRPFNEEILFTETYEPRVNSNGITEYWCITRQYKGNKKKTLISEGEVNTYLTQSPITYIPFIRSGSKFWGDSVYKGLLPIFDELNTRVTQIADVLDRHTDPNMYADQSYFDENNDLAVGNQVFPVDSAKGEQPPGYITWDFKADANFTFINEILIKMLQYISPIAPALYGLDDASQASGTSLRLKSWRSQSLIKRSQTYWTHALKKILFLAQQLENITGKVSYTPVIPLVELKISLPHDRLEEAQAEQLKVQAGVTSIKSAISRLNPHYTSAEVEAEWLEIINEQAEKDNLTFASTNRSLNPNE